MKFPYAYGAAALVLAQRSSAFSINPSRPSLVSQPQSPLKINDINAGRGKLMQLFSSDNNDAEDVKEFLGDDKSVEAGLAFIDVATDNMASLQKRLENGLDPDVRFFQGNTILHLITLKGREISLDDDRYKNILAQLLRSGADFQAKNDSGFTALEFSDGNKSDVFSEKIKQAQRAETKVSVKRDIIDAQLATFSLQKQPTANGKERIVALIKIGANPEVVASNGKKIIDNINDNWPNATAKAFNKLVIAASFKSEANGYEKTENKRLVNEQWTGALIGFYKANDSKN